MGIIVKLGHVEDIKSDKNGGLRIKARTEQDGNGSLPWAFPLMPKQFQVVPKIGEGVFVINENDSKKEGNRYYIGPIVSQNQFNEKCDFAYGRGEAMSMLYGRKKEPLTDINDDSRTHGSFPELNDVSMVGRESQDIIMKPNKSGGDEIVVRCGVRKKDTLAESNANRDKRLNNIGKIIFNDADPAYIQLKYKQGMASTVKNFNPYSGNKVVSKSTTNSAVNIVANKINLVGVNDESIGVKKTNKGEMIKDTDMAKMMSDLHQLPKGDVLVELIKLIMDAFLTHTHPWADLPPTISNYTLQLSTFNLNDILSDVVRIS